MKLISIFILMNLLCLIIWANDMFVVAGTGNPGFKDGNPGEMNKPIRITPYDDNSVIIADINNHAIRLVSLDGSIKTIAGGIDKEGFLDGNSNKAKFKSPHGVAYNLNTGELYVGEAGNHVIRKLTPLKKRSLEFTVSTFAGVPEKEGFNEGPAHQALFNSPHGIILDTEGNLIVADIGNARIRIVKDDKVKTIAGTGTFGQMNGMPLNSTFKYPMDMVLGINNNILIADAGTNLIRNLLYGKSVSTIQLKNKL